MIGGTGGQSQSNVIDYDTSEVYDSDLGRWATSGAKLPHPTGGLRATNIDGRVLIFGNISRCEDAAQQVLMSVCLSVHYQVEILHSKAAYDSFNNSRQCMIAYDGL